VKETLVKRNTDKLLRQKKEYRQMNMIEAKEKYRKTIEAIEKYRRMIGAKEKYRQMTIKEKIYTNTHQSKFKERLIQKND